MPTVLLRVIIFACLLLVALLVFCWLPCFGCLALVALLWLPCFGCFAGCFVITFWWLSLLYYSIHPITFLKYNYTMEHIYSRICSNALQKIKNIYNILV
jgi:hypothetical protein